MGGEDYRSHQDAFTKGNGFVEEDRGSGKYCIQRRNTTKVCSKQASRMGLENNCSKTEMHIKAST